MASSTAAACLEASVCESASRSRAESSRSGEPVALQMRRYLRASRCGRVGRISPCSNGNHTTRGSPTTRRSARKRARKARTARGSAASGVPELTSSTPSGAVTASAASSAKADAQELDLGVVEDAVLRAFAPDAGFLHAAERRHFGREQPGVQTDHAVLECLRDAEGARDIAGVEVSGEPELGVVGHANGI